MADLLDRMKAWHRDHSQCTETTHREVSARGLLSLAAEEIKALRGEVKDLKQDLETETGALEALMRLLLRRPIMEV